MNEESIYERRLQFTDRWIEEYEKSNGFPYFFQSAKDGTAATRLIKLGLTVDELIAVAKEAWAHPGWFNCKQASSLAGFACRFNEIRHELKNPVTFVSIARDEYNRVIQRMGMIRATYGDHQTWRDCDRTEWDKLRARKSELKQRLGVMV
jgi:hypothetical protein